MGFVDLSNWNVMFLACKYKRACLCLPPIYNHDWNSIIMRQIKFPAFCFLLLKTFYLNQGKNKFPTFARKNRNRQPPPVLRFKSSKEEQCELCPLDFHGDKGAECKISTNKTRARDRIITGILSENMLYKCQGLSRCPIYTDSVQFAQEQVMASFHDRSRGLVGGELSVLQPCYVNFNVVMRYLHRSRQTYFF